jgi:allantoicase
MQWQEKNHFCEVSVQDSWPECKHEETSEKYKWKDILEITSLKAERYHKYL